MSLPSCETCLHPYRGHLKKDLKKHLKTCPRSDTVVLTDAAGVVKNIKIPLVVADNGSLHSACFCSVCFTSERKYSLRPNAGAVLKHLQNNGATWNEPEAVTVQMKKPPSLYWDVKDACAARTKGNGEVLEALTETVDAESQASLPSETIPSTTGDAESFDMPERHGSAPTNSETPSESDWVMVEIADNEHQASAETHQVFENGDMHAGNKRKHEEASGGTDEDTSDDESELTSTLPSTRGLEEDENGYMASLGLGINVALRYIVCVECCRAVLLSEVLAHIRQVHHDTAPLLDLQKLQVAIESVGVELLDHWVDPGAHERPAYDGIAIRVGYKCLECLGAAFPALNSLRNHCRSAHKGFAFNRRHPFPRINLQQITSSVGPARKFFPVTIEDPGEDVQFMTEIMDQIYRTKSSVLSRATAQEADQRRYPEWLKRLGYPQEIGDRTDYEYLCGLVDISRGSDSTAEQGLLQAVKQITLEGNRLIPLTSELVLRRLATSEPSKSGYDHAPFKMLQVSQDAYDNEAFRVLVYLMRTRPSEEPSYEAQLPSDISALVDKVEQALNAPALVYAPSCVREAVLDLFTAIFTRSWEPNEGNRIPDPVIRTVMLTMIDRQGRWRGAESLTPILARLKRDIVSATFPVPEIEWLNKSPQRLVMLTRMHRLREERGTDSLDEISKELQPFYTEGHHTTFNSLAQTQHLASSIAMNQKAPPNIYWVEGTNRQELEYNGDRIRIIDWAAMIHAIQDSQETMLRKLMLDQTDLFIDYTDRRVADDPHAQSHGHSLFKDPRNYHIFFPDGETEILFRRVSAEEKLRDRFLRRTGSGWKVLPKAARAWLSDYSELSKLCITALILTGGGPARSTELTALNYANGRDGRIRNFLFHGRSGYVTKEYHKNSGRKTFEPIIPDFLDAHLTYVILQDLAVLRPFAITLANEAYGEDDKVMGLYLTKLFVCKSRLFDVNDLSDSLTMWTLRFLKARLSMRHVRHVELAIKRQEKLIVRDMDEDEVDIKASMASHSHAVEIKHYARSSDIHPESDETTWNEYKHCCWSMHVLFRLVPTGTKLTTMDGCHYSHFDTKLLEEIGPDRDQRRQIKEFQAAVVPVVDAAVKVMEQNILAALAGHNRSGEEVVPIANPKVFGIAPHDTEVTQPSWAIGRASSPASGVGENTTDPEKASDANCPVTLAEDTEPRDLSGAKNNTNHTGFLGGATASLHLKPLAHPQSPHLRRRDDLSQTALSGSRASTAPFRSDATVPSVPPEHWDSNAGPSAEAGRVLADLVKADTGKPLVPPNGGLELGPWSCEGQKAAVLATLAYSQDVVAVLPTGSGKSMIPLIASCMEPRSFTVIICPLNAVRDNTRRSLRRMGLAFQDYVSNEPVLVSTRILLVSSDQAQKSSFHAVITDAVRRCGYERCRTVIDEPQTWVTEETYRSTLRDANELRNGQMVLTSASIPPAMVEALRSTFGLLSGSGTSFIRSSTNRPEIEYSVMEAANSISEATGRAIDHFRAHFPASSARAILFVHTASDGKDAISVLQNADYEPGFYCGKTAGENFDPSWQSSAEKRDRLVDEWLTGRSGPFIVATMAMEAGQHALGVCASYHLRGPLNMIHFQQASGRIARGSGENGMAVVIPVSDGMFRSKALSPDLSGVRAMRQAIATPSACLREALTRFADGEDQAIKCTDDRAKGNRLCSRCQNASSASHRKRTSGTTEAWKPSLSPSQKQSQSPFDAAKQAALSSRTARMQRDAGVALPLLQAVQWLDGRCVACLVYGIGVPAHDILKGCESLASTPGFEDYVQSNKGIRYKESGTCFRCGFPLKAVGLEHPSVAGLSCGAVRCPHADVLKPVAFIARRDVGWRIAAGRRFDQNWSASTPEEVILRWLAEEKPFSQGGRGLTNMQEVFVWMMSCSKERELAEEEKDSSKVSTYS